MESRDYLPFKLKRIELIAPICFLIIAIFLVVIGYKENHKVNSELTFESSYIGKSELNGLYYAKQKDEKPDLYATAYSNQILNLLGKNFSDKTYELFNRQEDGSYKFNNLTYYDDPIYTTYLSYFGLGSNNIPNNKQVEDFLEKYKQKDGSFYYKLENIEETGGNLSEKKIVYTYMALYILKVSKADITSLTSTSNWIKQKINDKSVNNHMSLFSKLAKSLCFIEPDINYSRWHVDNNAFKLQLIEVLQCNYLNIDGINVIESLVELDSLGIYKLTDQQKKEIKSLLVKTLSTDISDKQSLYQAVNSYFKLEGNMKRGELKLLASKIKSEELPEGGISNITYIGTTRETLMALVIMKANNNYSEDHQLNDALITLLNNVVTGNEVHLDNADIYSLVACHKLLNLDSINSSQKEILIEKMKPFLKVILNEKTMRDWFYAVKTLELLDYKFVGTDLPENYNTFIYDTDKNGFINFSSEQNELFNAFVFDGLASIMPDNENLNRFIPVLLSLTNISESDDLMLKKRYYSSTALYKMGVLPESINQTLKKAEKLKCNMGYKSNQKVKDADLQSTFQVINLKLMKMRKGDDLYR